VGKTTVVYVNFPRDVVRQKLLKSANVSRSYSKNNSHSFFETRCKIVRSVITLNSSIKALLLTYSCLFIARLKFAQI